MTCTRRLKPLLLARLAGLLAILLVGVASGAWAQSATPEAGSTITNRATATFVDGITGRPFVLQSNSVFVQVQALPGLQLTLSQSVTRPPGSSIALAHRLVNTGNVPTECTLGAVTQPSSQYTLGNLGVLRDVNANGAPDAADLPLLSTDRVRLTPGQHVDLLVVGIVPPTALRGQATRVDLTADVAQAPASGLGAPLTTATNTDQVDVVEGPVVSVVKSAAVPTARPGDVVAFTSTAANLGSAAAAPTSITVDGTPASRFLLRDRIPANTTFVSASGSGAMGALLYHVQGDAADAWRSTVPAPPSQVDLVAWGSASLTVGQGVTLTLQARIHDGVGSDILNTAEAAFVFNGAQVQPSNTVTVMVPKSMPSILYYTNDQYLTVARSSRVGDLLRVQVTWSGGNTDPAAVETITITLTSAKTGDTQSFTAVESGPNTGLFRILGGVPTSSGAGGISPGDGVLQTVPDDDITAQEASSGFAVSTDILIDPFGVVFDSRTNALIEGATVTLLDVTGAGNGGNPGGPARVFAPDGVTPAPSTVVTGADGAFQFPLVPASVYRLQVVPPAGKTFPSRLPPPQLPAGRVLVEPGSYGGTFPVNTTTGAVRLDVPVDGSAPGLFVEKTASAEQIEIGEFVTYTVKLSNPSDAIVTGTVINDRLPVGFAYELGTARLDGIMTPDPSGGRGPLLQFALGSVAPGQARTLTYRVRVGPGAAEGEQLNTAQAQASFALGSIVSNVGRARVRVVPGVFSDKGIIFGKAFLDRNGNHVQDKDEPGVPGVRLYVEDGSSVITDEEGKYSLYGMLARTHVMRLDRSTLPRRARTISTSSRAAGSGLSRFVDLKRNELHRADFVIVPSEPAAAEDVEAQVEARRKAAHAAPEEAARALEVRLNADGRVDSLGDLRARPAAGTLGGESLTPPAVAAPPAGKGLNLDNSGQPTPPERKQPKVDLQSLMQGLKPEVGFVDYATGDVLPAPQASIRVKGRTGCRLQLTVNGRQLPLGQVGARSTLPSKGLQLWEYVGVDLKPGDNSLTVALVDDFGIVRERSTIELKVPGQAARLEVELPERDPQADGRTAIPVTVRIVDATGLKVGSRLPLTLESQVGTWDTPDLDPREPGVQTFLTGGSQVFHLVPGNEPTECELRISSGSLKCEKALRLVQARRPFFLTGIVEAQADMRRVSTGDQAPTRIDNLLEVELDRVAQADTASSRAGGRVAVFGKGSISDDATLTFRYDSNQRRNQSLFRDIQPLEYYPIYGDASVKGFEAQSTSPLYLRLDQGRNFLLHGDYTTATGVAEPGLSTYSRSLTGVRGHLENDFFAANAFASHTRQRQIVDELPTNGTSGPYLFRLNGYVLNSEKVEIITRDRNQPGVVLKSQPLTRFTDYVVDASFGGIILRRPATILDSNLNPQYLRVVYEAESGTPFYWTYGGDVRLQLSRRLMLGISYAREGVQGDPYSLYGVQLGYKMGPATRLVAEVAGSSRRTTGNGTADRVELLHDDGRLQARLLNGRSDAGFDNPTALISRGRSERSARVTYRVDDKTRLKGEYIRTGDVTTGGRRSGFEVAAERALSPTTRLEVGLRHANESATPAQATSVGASPNRLTTARARLTTQVPNHPEASVFGEYEQDLNSSSRRALALGGEYQLGNRSRVYARHELISSLSGRYNLNTQQTQNSTVVGIDTDYMKDGHVYSEYRVRDAISGRENQAAIGLRNQFAVGKGVRLNTGYERVIGGSTLGQSTTAASLGVEYTASRDVKASGRLEYRSGGGTRGWLNNLGVAWRVSPDVSLLARSVGDTSRGSNLALGERIRQRMLLGMAYRPLHDNRLAGLVKYERRYVADDPSSPVRCVEIVTAAGNYQVTPRFTLSAYLANKWMREKQYASMSDANATMVGGRVIYDLGNRWDVSLQGARLFTPGGRSDKHSVGVEAGYLVTDDFWLSGGYNVIGYDDADLRGVSYTARGPYVRLRLRLGVDDFGADAFETDRQEAAAKGSPKARTGEKDR